MLSEVMGYGPSTENSAGSASGKKASCPVALLAPGFSPAPVAATRRGPWAAIADEKNLLAVQPHARHPAHCCGRFVAVAGRFLVQIPLELLDVFPEASLLG